MHIYVCVCIYVWEYIGMQVYAYVYTYEHTHTHVDFPAVFMGRAQEQRPRAANLAPRPWSSLRGTKASRRNGWFQGWFPTRQAACSIQHLCSCALQILRSQSQFLPPTVGMILSQSSWTTMKLVMILRTLKNSHQPETVTYFYSVFQQTFLQRYCKTWILTRIMVSVPYLQLLPHFYSHTFCLTLQV